MSERKIINLYEHFKNTKKKLKIICDWDEVIQPCEPYALWKALKIENHKVENFPKFFVNYYQENYQKREYDKTTKIAQKSIKKLPDFYQHAPFLTIAEDLLKLIRENKVKYLIFLSTDNKKEIFKETFGKLAGGTKQKQKNNYFFGSEEFICDLQSEGEKQSRIDWIRENASDFDIVIDYNPNICKEIVEVESKLRDKKIIVLAPYYLTVEKEHDERVLLVKNEASDLKKEDFKYK